MLKIINLDIKGLQNNNFQRPKRDNRGHYVFSNSIYEIIGLFQFT